MQRKGFTLVELLVVFAIVAILSAMLFPVFGKVREGGRAASCTSNERQLSAAMAQYVQDHDDTLPALCFWWPGKEWSGDYDHGLHWAQAILPYVRTQQVFKCPTNGNTTQVNGGPDYPPLSNNYAANQHLITDDKGNPVAIASIQAPATKILIAEGNQGWSGTDVIGWPDWCAGCDNANGWSGEAWSGHMGRANYAFADGHVKSYRPKQTMAGANLWGQFQNQANTPTCQDYRNCDEPYAPAREAMTGLEATYD